MRNITKNSDLARISSCLERSSKKNFFKQWLEFIRPVHRLAHKDIDVLATFLQLRYELSRNIKDEDLLDTILMSVESKRQVREAVGLSTNYFQVVMSKLKKRGVIGNNGKIHPRFIPKLELDSTGYKLTIFFDFREDSHDKRQNITRNN